jgi:hypothetical protein
MSACEQGCQQLFDDRFLTHDDFRKFPLDVLDRVLEFF